ncbi:hypothetical protein ACIF6I_17900 [Streptomyces microflavus]|uniref:hypothetical protein n=1 Tax=Streptomyces microflavus TaxID=1919 RepID=UPI002DDBEF19|nr:hypothetical protein [Streptomyces microflavus]WSA59846.1 hypothetical protein OHB31_06555 [Streptomyces microflavus]
MRPSQEPSVGMSATPIYDALYSEYRRSFRALPGDRSGEENLRFPAFGAGLFASRAPLGHSAPAGQDRHSGTGSGSGSGQSQHTGTLGSWQRVGRHAGRPRPAALPPGSRES